MMISQVSTKYLYILNSLQVLYFFTETCSFELNTLFSRGNAVIFGTYGAAWGAAAIAVCAFSAGSLCWLSWAVTAFWVAMTFAAAGNNDGATTGGDNRIKPIIWKYLLSEVTCKMSLATIAVSLLVLMKYAFLKREWNNHHHQNF